MWEVHEPPYYIKIASPLLGANGVDHVIERGLHLTAAEFQLATTRCPTSRTICLGSALIPYLLQ